MALSDFQKDLDKMTVQVIENGDSYSVLVGGKIICQMATGGCQRFGSKVQAEVFGNQYTRGYTAGSYLSEDVENFLV